MSAGVKRANGEGSVYRRVRRGRVEWVAELRWVRPDGGLGRVQRVARSKRDAWAVLDVLRRERAGGGPVGESVDVASWMGHWVGVVCEQRVAAGLLRRSTLDYCRSVSARSVVPLLGRRQLGSLSRGDVEWWLAALAGQGLGERGVGAAHAVLRAALSSAVAHERVARNVAALVRPPAYRPPRVEPLALGEARALLAACAGDRLGTLVTVALALAMRPGEATGLEWASVDLDAGELAAAANLTRESDPAAQVPARRWVLADTKGHRPETLPLPPFAVDALRRRRGLQAEERLAAGRWSPTSAWVLAERAQRPLDLVWTSPGGEALGPAQGEGVGGGVRAGGDPQVDAATAAPRRRDADAGAGHRPGGDPDGAAPLQHHRDRALQPRARVGAARGRRPHAGRARRA